MVKKSILIVEDETIIGKHIQNSLVKLGYDVCGCVRSGEEALRSAAELKPSLILMDIILAGPMDGIVAAKIIKETLGIPVVYMTGNADVPTITRARETSPYGYVLKPVNILHLFSTIDTALHRHGLEKQLVESEEKYRFLTDKMSDLVWIMDMNMRTTYVGPSVVNMLGYTAEERYSQKIEEMLTPDSLALALRTFAGELKLEETGNADPGRTITMEVEYYHKNGSTVWVENKMRAIRDQDGKMIGIHGVSRDITERKHVEEALRQSEIKFRSLSDSSPIGVFYTDTGGNVLYMNPRWLQITGLTPEQGYGAGWYSALHPDDYQRVDRAWKSTIRKRQAGGMEFRFVNPDGTIRWVFTRIAPIIADSGGITGFVGTNEDITERKLSEQALRESEGRFRALVQNFQDIILIMDADGVVTFENPVTAAILGYSLAGKPVFDYIHPDDVARTRNAYRKVVEGTDDDTPHLLRIRHNGDSWLYMEAIAENLIDDMSIRGLLVVCRNVTQRMEAQTALRESEQRYHALFHQSPVGVFMFNRDLVLTECNERLAQIMGAPRGKIIGYDLNMLVEEAVIPHLKETLLGNVKYYEGPYRATLGNASLWVNVTASPIRDDNGNVIGGMGVIQDVTARKRAEEKLRVSEERNRLLVQNANEGIVVLQDWRFVFVNPRFINLTGYNAEHLMSREFTEFIHPDDREMISDRYRKRLEGDTTPFTYEARLVDRSGVIRWIELNSVLFDWEGKPAVLLFLRDIAERKQAEEERKKMDAQIQQTQKLESLGVLAGGIAHDFNNLLMAILGNIDLALLDLSPTSPSRSNLQEAAKASQRAADLCRQMLAYSGKGRFMSQVLSLNDIIEDMRHMLEVSVSKKALLRYNFTSDLPSIEADATQMRQIIMNLVINASDAIGEKSGIISLSTGVMECDRPYLSETWLNEGLPEGTYVYIEVTDTGCGMDPETLTKIFDPFFTTKFTGRGLGLAAVLGIVRGHKGAIKLFSERGQGTSFKILLPAVKEAPETAGHTRDAEAAWRGSGTILLADDEETVLSLGKRMLERFGFTVLTAANGREALEIFRGHADEIICVILDLTMPHMDGEEAFRELQAVRDNVRVIMSSGYNEQEITHRFPGKGPAGFIQKPYQMEDLAAVLRKVIG